MIRNQMAMKTFHLGEYDIHKKNGSKYKGIINFKEGMKVKKQREIRRF